jgi:hypothetical protein
MSYEYRIVEIRPGDEDGDPDVRIARSRHYSSLEETREVIRLVKERTPISRRRKLEIEKRQIGVWVDLEAPGPGRLG